MPRNFQVTVSESNICTMSWQPPADLSIRHGTILHYIVNCSSQEFAQDQSENSTQMFQMFTLQPYLVYECCVLGVNQVGLGNSSCQTIITNEAGVYTIIIVTPEIHSINDNYTCSMSIYYSIVCI